MIVGGILSRIGGLVGMAAAHLGFNSLFGDDGKMDPTKVGDTAKSVKAAIGGVGPQDESNALVAIALASGVRASWKCPDGELKDFHEKLHAVVTGLNTLSPAKAEKFQAILGLQVLEVTHREPAAKMDRNIAKRTKGKDGVTEEGLVEKPIIIESLRLDNPSAVLILGWLKGYAWEESDKGAVRVIEFLVKGQYLDNASDTFKHHRDQTLNWTKSAYAWLEKQETVGSVAKATLGQEWHQSTVRAVEDSVKHVDGDTPESLLGRRMNAYKVQFKQSLEQGTARIKANKPSRTWIFIPVLMVVAMIVIMALANL